MANLASLPLWVRTLIASKNQEIVDLKAQLAVAALVPVPLVLDERPPVYYFSYTLPGPGYPLPVMSRVTFSHPTPDSTEPTPDRITAHIADIGHPDRPPRLVIRSNGTNLVIRPKGSNLIEIDL